MFYKFLFYILLTFNCSNCFIIPSQPYYPKNKNLQKLPKLREFRNIQKFKMIEDDNSLQVFSIIVIGHFITFLLYAAFNPPQDYKKTPILPKKNEKFIKSDDSCNIDINIFL